MYTEEMFQILALFSFLSIMVLNGIFCISSCLHTMSQCSQRVTGEGKLLNNFP